MTIPDDRTAFASTSAGWMQHVREPVLLGCMLAGLGTSSARALPLEILPRVTRAAEQTSSGTSLPEVEPAGVAIAELRRRSGLTWDQLARLFSVSRRALHFWASGKPMTPSNEEHLQRLLSALRKIDRGSASANRSILLRVDEDGSMVFDLLAARDYDGVVALLGGQEPQRARPPKLAREVRTARAPRPPEELAAAQQDRIHPASGRLLGAKAVRPAGLK